MGTKDLKEAVHRHCNALLAERAAETERTIARLALLAQGSGAFAADARTGMEKQWAILRNLEEMAAIMATMVPSDQHHAIERGALARTDMGVFYIAVALGRTYFDGIPLWVVAPEAPIVEVLRRTPLGEIAFFNGTAYRMQQVA